MYQLISVSREDLEIATSIHPTKEAAINAMIADIILQTNYESLEDIVKAAEDGECGFSENDAWAETNQFGTGTWKIEELPGSPDTSVKDLGNTSITQLQLRIPGKGYFWAITSPEKGYPGIDVEFVAEDDEGKTASRPRVVFEYPEEGNLRMLIWADKNSEDYTDCIDFGSED